MAVIEIDRMTMLRRPRSGDHYIYYVGGGIAKIGTIVEVGATHLEVQYNERQSLHEPIGNVGRFHDNMLGWRDVWEQKLPA